MKIICFFAFAICVASALPQKMEDAPPVPGQVEKASSKAATPRLEENCDSTGVVCRSNCLGDRSGQFQYCGNCSTFLVCDEYVTYYGYCPGDLRWDDATKRCGDVSSTCEECYVAPKCSITGPSCSNDCASRPNGYHQICDNCTSYASCTNQELVNVLHCPEGLYFHDQVPKGCVSQSETCIECFDLAFCNSTGPNCISSCDQVEGDGVYQSCDNCVQFTQCNNGNMFNVYCPVGMYYDDNSRGCVETSATCMHCAVPDICESTGQGCVRRCNDLDNGFYQACTNCTTYIECEDNAIFYRSCPSGWHWDDAVVACLPSSSTCEECLSRYW